MAKVTVKIPTPLRKLTAGQDLVTAEGATVLAAIDDVEARHAGFKTKLVDENNKVRRFMNVYCNEDDVRFLQGLGTELRDGDVISVIPAIAGGR